MYWAIAFADDTSYPIECDDYIVNENHVVFRSEGRVEHIVPISHVKIMSVISEEDYAAMVESSMSGDEE